MKITPPQAAAKPKVLETHNDVRIDNYYWLNERENPDVISHLKAENAYFEHATSHTKTLQDQLFQEMKSRIKEDDSSVPYKFNGYWYITKFETDKDYPIYTRKKESLDAEEELLFDCNVMAEGHSYFNLSGISVSPNNKYVAYGIDTVSRRQYQIQIKNLETGELLLDKIENTTGGSSWGNDNKTLFYTLNNTETLRAERVMKHKLNTDAVKDALVFHEADDTFTTSVYKSKSKAYLIIRSSSTISTEYRILDANTPDGNFVCFQPRLPHLEYDISHYQNTFYILTNANKAFNFKLMKTSADATDKENWVDVIPHRESVLVEDMELFKDYLVVSEREHGLAKIRIIRWDGKDEYYLPFANETYTAHTTINPDFDTQLLRYSYSSLTTPSSVFEFNMLSKESTLKKQLQVLDSSFNEQNYESKRIWAKADDGESVPMSIVYKNGMVLNGKNPTLLYAYGSYGHTIDPSFSSIRLSLLNRGFIYAIAHVRGGEYLGRTWYENGKLLNKKNTFTDFISCAEYLVSMNYTSSNNLFAMGGSAGGLLMGVLANEAPHLFKGIIAQVPFVDVVTTMLDDTIPLTTGEYDEWGNPNIEHYYKYMKSYSPYDNVKPQNYPNILITTGFYDSQVQYWEPVKWALKLREHNLASTKVLIKIDLDTGHGGASGRFEGLKEIAEEFAFIFDLQGIDI